MNLIFLCTELKRLYNVIVDELLYDSEMERLVAGNCAQPFPNDDSDTRTDTSTDSVLSDDSISSDDTYSQIFRHKSEFQSVLFMKRSLCFLIIDIYDNCYGIYYPGTIDRELNCCLNVSLFSLSRGIEIAVRKYNVVSAFGYISFSRNDYLLEMGAKNWLLRLYTDRIIFNENQRVLESYNKTIMKSASLKQILVFNCK